VIVVLGSLNLDLVVECERIPLPGETVLGTGFASLPGGKGANQAYAAARLARGPVKMVGRVGDDAFGSELRGNLERVGVDVSDVVTVAGVASGVATITVDRKGQNSIVVASGANAVWGECAVDWSGVRYAMFQLETPGHVVLQMARDAKRAGVMTVLDPAPAVALSREMVEVMDLITPNEHEAAVIGEVPREKLVLKLGEKGSRWMGVSVPAIAVEAVDTTAAGDTYNAGLVVGLSEGMEMREAMRMASVAAGISVTRRGAQASAPGREEVERYLASW
jgi:ribokinase